MPRIFRCEAGSRASSVLCASLAGPSRTQAAVLVLGFLAIVTAHPAALAIRSVTGVFAVAGIPVVEVGGCDIGAVVVVTVVVLRFALGCRLDVFRVGIILGLFLDEAEQFFGLRFRALLFVVGGESEATLVAIAVHRVDRDTVTREVGLVDRVDELAFFREDHAAIFHGGQGHAGEMANDGFGVQVCQLSAPSLVVWKSFGF